MRGGEGTYAYEYDKYGTVNVLTHVRQSYHYAARPTRSISFCPRTLQEEPEINPAAA